ncbi:hypothetical protein WJX72_010596 [[Myrmecia] bisecta]|uniref:Uncharacterized protein n=1 Tax=[Myrmecia] bisecta TaxID=41462 RepID=A0AAW1QSB6_9CHLO
MSEGEYEDDFEAYQDDFEDEEPEPHHKHMPPAPGRLPLSPLGGNKAQELQRPRIPLTANASTTWPTPSKPSMLVSRAQMGLSDAQRAALAQRKARWDAIRPQVRLQEAIMDEMFSMPPLSQYALSQMGRGQYRGLVAASSQTGADAQAESCQTDTIPVNSISSQAPDEPAMQPSPAQRSGSSKALAAAKSSVPIAGLAEGGLCLWDLRESAAQHPMESIGGDPSECCRRPTYTTEWEGDAASAGPIVALQVVPPQKHGEAAQGGALAGRGYTSLISLTSWGHVSVYTIQELSSLEAGGSGEALLGTDAVAMRSTWALASLPGDGSQFLVGGEDGRVMRGSLYGRPPPPKEYFLEDPLHALNTSTSSRITSITFSPCLPEAFLAIHAPSAIAVYSIHHSLPRLAMQGFSSSPLTHACWSPVRPAVFFVLDALSSLHCFDLLRDRTAPVLVAPLCGTTKSSIMSMEIQQGRQRPSL